MLLSNKYKRVLISPLRLLIRSVGMVLQALASALPWNWSAGSKDRKGAEKKKVVRSRAEQVVVAKGTSEGEPQS